MLSIFAAAMMQISPFVGKSIVVSYSISSVSFKF